MTLLEKYSVRMVMIAGLLLPLSSYAANEETSSTLPKPAPINDNREYKPHIGLLAGVANPQGEDGNRGEFGLDWGYQPYIPFGVGLELTATEVNDTRRTTLLGRATYNFGGTTPVIKDSYVGVGLGPVFLTDGTRLGSAPMVGFDIPLKAAEAYYMSLGLTAKYLVIEGSTPDEAALAATVKYWY